MEITESTPKLTRRIHMSMNVAGFLKTAAFPRQFRFFTDDAGHEMTPAVARDTLKLELARGRKLLPLCDPKECPDFSFETGCPGHPIEAKPDAAT